MNTSLLLVGLAVSTVGLAPPTLAPSSSQSLRFHVEPGTRIDKTFRVRESAVSSDFRVFMGGQPVPSEFLPKLELAHENSIRVALLDTYGNSEGGRLLGFKREYKSLEGEGSFSVEVPPAEPEESNWQRESPLVGEQVSFAWDPKAEAYERSLTGGGKSPEPLENLAAETDLLGFLPEDDVELGDSWTVDADVLLGLFNPGGSIGLDADEDDEELPYEPTGIEGELMIRFVKVEEEDGVKIAKLAIEGECERTAERASDLSRVPVADGAATDVVTWNYELEGELLWSLDAGHALSLDLSATFDHMLRTDRDPDQGGPDYASEIESAGELEIHVEFTAVESARD